MSDIATLITSLLMTKPPFSSHLLDPPVIKPEQDMQKLMQDQSYQLISAAQVASYRSIRSMNNCPVISLTRNLKSQKTRITKIKQIFGKDLDKLTKSSAYRCLKDKFSEEKPSVAKQRRDNLAFIKLKKASFIKSKKLIPENNSNDILIASSQRFTNQKLPNLSFNSSGVAVRALQRLLISNGYSVPVDGVFGALTESAVKAFQAQRDLTVDGIVGLETWHSLATSHKSFKSGF